MVSKTPERAEGPEKHLSVSAWKSEIAARIDQAVREAGGATVIARQCGVTRQTLFNYSSGTHEPKLINLAKIAKTCGVSLDWIAWGGNMRLIAGGAPPRDEGLLVAAIQLVEELDERRDLKFSSDKKAQLIANIYQSMTSE